MPRPARPPAPNSIRRLQLFVPGRLTNPLNGSHRHWSQLAKWAGGWRTKTQLEWLAAGQPMWEGPARITFTAVVRRRFDDDNLAACIKPVRDAAVRAICGTDDGPNCGHWFVYKQSVASGTEPGVLITVGPLPPGLRGTGVGG